LASNASETANMIAPPTPWIARAALRKAMSPASAHSTDATVNSARPAVNRRRRPKRSARAPAVSTVEARASV
jgi:hypothetical protein